MEKNESWVRLPLAVLQDKRLTPYEAIILSILIDRDTGTGEMQISIDTLIELSGISRRKVKSCLHLLRDTGYISVTRTGRESIYTVAQILPPKKRSGQAQYSKKKKKKADENAFCDMDHFEEDYEIFINNF